jgi:hypothetical protein
MPFDKKHIESLVGKHVYVMTRQGALLDGILHKYDEDKIILHSKAKPVSTSAFLPFFNPFTPLILFDLLAIAETPFFFGRSPFFF